MIGQCVSSLKLHPDVRELCNRPIHLSVLLAIFAWADQRSRTLDLTLSMHGAFTKCEESFNYRCEESLN